MQPSHAPHSPVRLTRPGFQYTLRSKSSLLMPKANLPGHGGEPPNRRHSRLSAGACGSLRVPACILDSE